MRTFLNIFLTLVIIGLTVLFNIGLIDIRLEEIKYMLGNIAAQETVSNTFGIVAKYELIKRRMLYGEENISNYELEAKIQALTTGDNLKDNKPAWQSKFYRFPIRLTLNTIRYLQGKRIFSPKEDDKVFSVLEIAYFYERNRKYIEALKVYDEILLSSSLLPEIRAAVLVHKSFCHSMLSDYGKSKQVYEIVINEYPNTEAGILAWKLLDFIQSIEMERESLNSKKMTGIEKAKQFYLLMDFRNAIKNYSVFLSADAASANVAEARFYKGRAHEELGEIEESIMEYRRVMQVDKTKMWARQANRRMLMLGSFYEQQKQIADEAKRQLESYQDQVFINNVEKYSDMVSPSSLKGELQKNNGTSVAVVKSNDSILSIIDKIGSLDLTGSQEKEKQRTDALRRELMKRGNLTSAEVKEVERRQVLAQNPYRRPSALKKDIDENSSELRYIYNKRLRTGVKLSGKMLVEMRINADGSLSKVRLVESNMGDTGFELEVVKRIESWKFKAVPDSLGEFTVNYPFEFYEEL